MTALPHGGRPTLADRRLSVGLLSAMVRKDRKGTDLLLEEATTATMRSLAGLSLLLISQREGGLPEAEEWLRTLAMSLAQEEDRRDA